LVFSFFASLLFSSLLSQREEKSKERNEEAESLIFDNQRLQPIMNKEIFFK